MELKVNGLNFLYDQNEEILSATLRLVGEENSSNLSASVYLHKDEGYNFSELTPEQLKQNAIAKLKDLIGKV